MNPFRFGGLIVENSALGNGVDGELSWTPTSAGDLRKGTVCFDVKLCREGVSEAIYAAHFDDNNRALIYKSSGGNIIVSFVVAAAVYTWTGTSSLKDYAAHLNVTVGWNTAAISGSRMKVELNGVAELGAWGTEIPLNTDVQYNNNVVHTILRQTFAANPLWAEIYLSNFLSLDGLKTDYAAINGFDAEGYVNLKRNSNPYGTNGFYLDFVDTIEWTNLFTYSEDLSHADWSLIRSTVTANAITAPDGNTTAEKVTMDVSTELSHIIRQKYSYTAGKYYSWGIYAKAAELSDIFISCNNGPWTTQPYAYFDLIAGTVGTSEYCTGHIEDVGDGWYRCIIIPSTPCDVTTPTNNTNFYLSDGEDFLLVGDGTSGIYMWGAQFEESNTALEVNPYIPTTTTAATAGGLGRDVSGNDNHFTVNGTITQTTDTPTDSVARGVGNVATPNPLDPTLVGTTTFSNGNKTVTISTNADRHIGSTLKATSGAYRIETLVDTVDASYNRIGVRPDPLIATGVLYQNDGTKYVDAVNSAYGATYTTSDVIACEFDLDNNTVEFFKQTSGTGSFVSQGSIAYDFGGAAVGGYIYVFTSGAGFTARYAESDWGGTATAGFKSLATQNMPAVALSSPQTGSFTGNANANGANVNIGFRPDISATSTINGNTITWGTHAIATATGFKLITASASYNAAGANTYSIVVDQVTQGGTKKSGQARAQGN